MIDCMYGDIILTFYKLNYDIVSMFTKRNIFSFIL